VCNNLFTDAGFVVVTYQTAAGGFLAAFGGRLSGHKSCASSVLYRTRGSAAGSLQGEPKVHSFRPGDLETGEIHKI